MGEQKSKIGFSLNFCKPADAVEDFIDKVIRLRLLHSHDETGEVMVRKIVQMYDMVDRPVGVLVTVEDNRRATFVPLGFVEHPTEKRVHGSIHFPGGCCFEDVQVVLTDKTQKCVGVLAGG